MIIRGGWITRGKVDVGVFASPFFLFFLELVYTGIYICVYVLHIHIDICTLGRGIVENGGVIGGSPKKKLRHCFNYAVS